MRITRTSFAAGLGIALAGLALLCTAPAPSRADAGRPAEALFSATIFERSVIPIRTATLRGIQPASASPVRLPDDLLHFRPAQRVDAAARDRLLASLLETAENPADRQRIRDSVADSEIWDKFDRILGFAGYSSRNLADVTTAFYVIAWEVVNDGQAIDHLGGVRLDRDSVARAMLRDTRLAAMSDAEKQEAAVVMAYMAIVAGHRARELCDAGDGPALEALRGAVRRSVLQGQGVDLGRLQLTDLGFVAD